MSDLAITPHGQMGDANADAARRLRKAADQMEGMFLNLLFKQLEEASEDSSDLYGDSPASKQFNQLFHNALSENAAGGMGIADAVYRQLALKAGITPTPRLPPEGVPPRQEVQP